MSKSSYLIVFVVAIALASARSQTAAAGSSAANQKGEPQTSAPPAQSSQPSQTGAGPQQGSKPSTTVPGGATDASGGGVVGAAGSAMGKTQVPDAPETPAAAAAIPDRDLQTDIQNALSKEPTLSGDTVNVTVSPDSVEMAGSVATAREKQTATRIVQSYAGNKKIVSHLTISGRNRNAAPGASGSANQQQPASGSPPR